ncbi:MAG: rhodanese-like domain-containing protein [Candidatus Planktophila sp.]
MKKLIAVIFASTLALTSCGGSAATNMGATDFQKKTQEAGVIVLDVRSAGEFYTGHIANAINIDVEGMTFGADIAKLDKSKTYAVYCHSGRRSGIAVGKMAAAGFKSLYNLDGGIQVWQAAGLPLVTQ